MWWKENKIISMLQAFFCTVIGIILFIPITIGNRDHGSYCSHGGRVYGELGKE